MRLVIILGFLFLQQSFALAINPEKEYPYKPESFGISNYTTNYITTTDNVKLISWNFPPLNRSTKKITVIIAYGDSGNMSYSLFYVKKLIEMGVHVVTFDYRGFGKSEAFKMDNNYLYYSQFAEDLRAVLLHTKNKIVNGEKIGIMCFSMGTIVTTLVAGLEKLDFMVSENFVSNPTSVLERLDTIKQKKMLLPKDSPSNFELLIAKISCPMLLFVSTVDEITTVEDSKTVITQGTRRKMIEYSGNHGEGLTSLTKNSPGDLYFQYVRDFLEI